MFVIALRMLFGDKAKYFGIVMGVTLASMVITQQGSIFIGIMSRTFATITDMPQGDVWVMDRKVQFIDDVKPLPSTDLFRIRGVAGVAWAYPLFKGQIRARMANGQFVNCNLYGVDDATLVGAPSDMVSGLASDLRQSDSVLVDWSGATGRLARPQPGGGKPVPLRVGDELELNDNRAVVVGIARASRTFQSQPNIYTTYNRATKFAPRERKLLSFILVKAQAGEDVSALCARISKETGLAAYTNDEFKTVTVNYFIRSTGIPINFGMATALGFLVGTVITGFMFYSFTIDNLRYFGTLKAMGTSDARLLSMIMLQGLIVGSVGFGLGVGLASLFGHVNGLGKGVLAFRMPWQLLFVSACAVVVICLLSAMLSMRKVIALEPAVVFKG